MTGSLILLTYDIFTIPLISLKEFVCFFIFFIKYPPGFLLEFAPSDSISLRLTQVFSFGLVWIHILSIVRLFVDSSKGKKELYLFSSYLLFLWGH